MPSDCTFLSRQLNLLINTARKLNIWRKGETTVAG
uniref:Uncharacterized protein n=1 Tax=Anguilla anguilla TaxID=7936 RepID=A0A0E9RIB8_ANGAN